MKITIVIVRVLLGLIFLFSSVVVLFNLVPQPELAGDVAIFNMGLERSGYLIPLLKITELLCAIAFITGRFVPLAAVVIFPIILNILLFHMFLAPEGLPIAVFLFLGDLLLAYANRQNYAPLLVAH